MLNKDIIKQDLYQAVNGEWLKTAVIPDDKPTTGGFSELDKKTEEMLIEDFNNLKDVDNNEMKEFLKYYNMTKDFETRNKTGMKVLEGLVNKLENMKNFSDFSALINEWIFKGLTLPFKFIVYADMMDATRNVLYLDIASIILPDKTYYDDSNEDKERLLKIYSDMLDKLFNLYGFPEEKRKTLIENTLKLDNLMQVHTKTSEELADYTKINNPRTMEEVENYSNVISFKKIVKDIIKEEPNKIIVEQPKFFEAFNEFINQENFELLKSWLISKLFTSTSKLLTSEARIIGGEYGRALSGVVKEISEEKYAYNLSTSVYSDVVSVYYGKKYFGEKAKKDVEDMVKSMIKVYEKRLNNNDWLKEETRKKAVKKLETLAILIGYPETYKDIYKKLIVDESKSFFENTLDFTVIENEYMFSKWNTEVEKLEWGMSSNTVNAYYNPSVNHICFPAAILQAPFYSLNQSRSANFGGIGAVIGHEISHAFDNNGSKFDENGNLNNWWAEEDFKIFDEKAKAMIDQFEGIPFGSSKVNGTLTVSENIADAGGISCALEALKNSGEYNLEDFFINWAKIWCRKARPEYVDLLLKIDVHAPGELRANIQPRNLKEFYETFGIKEEDAMYLAPEKRVSIW